jgi:hypothetical protein
VQLPVTSLLLVPAVWTTQPRTPSTPHPPQYTQQQSTSQPTCRVWEWEQQCNACCCCSLANYDYPPSPQKQAPLAPTHTPTHGSEASWALQRPGGLREGIPPQTHVLRTVTQPTQPPNNLGLGAGRAWITQTGMCTRPLLPQMDPCPPNAHPRQTVRQPSLIPPSPRPSSREHLHTQLVSADHTCQTARGCRRGRRPHCCPSVQEGGGGREQPPPPPSHTTHTPVTHPPHTTLRLTHHNPCLPAHPAFAPSGPLPPKCTPKTDSKAT